MIIKINGGRIPFAEINSILRIIESYGYNITRKQDGIVCTPIPNHTPSSPRQLPLPLFAEMPSPKATKGVRS